MQTRSNILKSAGLCFVALMTGLQAVHGGGRHPMFDESRTTHVTHAIDTGLNIRTDNGAITIKRSNRADVEIAAHIRCVSPERLEAVAIIAERTGDGTLKIYVKWPDMKRKNNERCSFEVLVPDAWNIDLYSANGAIVCEDLGGNAILQTSNGGITIHGHDGPVNASTSNGAIDIRDVAGTLKATTSNGKIMAQHIDGAAELRTSNGAIEAVGVVSPVSVHTSNGSISLELAPSFAGEMTASTSHGSLDINGLEDAKLISSGKNRIVCAIGESDHKSSASTSNGSIRIKSRL